MCTTHVQSTECYMQYLQCSPLSSFFRSDHKLNSYFMHNKSCDRLCVDWNLHNFKVILLAYMAHGNFIIVAKYRFVWPREWSRAEQTYNDRFLLLRLKFYVNEHFDNIFFSILQFNEMRHIMISFLFNATQFHEKT